MRQPRLSGSRLPPLQSRRDRHHEPDGLRPSRPFEFSKSKALASHVLVPAAGVEPTFTVSETGVLPLDEAGMASRAQSRTEWCRSESNRARSLKGRLLRLGATAPFLSGARDRSHVVPAVGRTGVEPAPIELKARCSPLSYRPACHARGKRFFLVSFFIIVIQSCTARESNSPGPKAPGLQPSPHP